MNQSLVIIAHNIRSTHNVGALLRTADGLGINHIYFTGYTPYPALPQNDPRLPHIAQKLDAQINKTALGAAATVPWSQTEDVMSVLQDLRSSGYTVAGLEQTETSVLLPTYKPPQKLAIVLGSEVTGIDAALLNQLDEAIEIPMVGKKESFNVVEVATMMMYHCKRVAPHL